ncbi:MAG: hypothetical protein FWD26_04915 [Treponema sp.]|nr:hypothetical protein [Treponema sp.]
MEQSNNKRIIKYLFLVIIILFSISTVGCMTFLEIFFGILAESTVEADSKGLKSYTVNIYYETANNTTRTEIYVVDATSRWDAEKKGKERFRMRFPHANIKRILVTGPYKR